MTTKPPSATASMQAVVEEIVRTNPKLRESVEQLVSAAIKHALWTMQHGTIQDRTAIMRQIALPMMKVLGDVSEGDAQREQREAIARMYAEMRGDS